MDSVNSGKKRLYCNPPLPGNYDLRIALASNHSLVDLNKIIDQRVEDAAKAKTRALTSRNSDMQGENERLRQRCESLERSIHLFPSTEHACHLIDAILEHPSINHHLDLSRSMNKGIIPSLPLKLLLHGLKTAPLKMLDLSNNGIATNGDRCIPDFLATNPPLESLYLGGNELNDDDAHHIALALQSNTNLRCLNLEDNAMTKNGKISMYLLSVLGLNLSDLSGLKPVWAANLNTVSEANHTCEIVGVSGPRNFMNRSDKSAKWNRGRKLLSLLAKRHRRGPMIPQLQSEFSEDGMGLVPRIFSCINTYSERHCLSILFELVRDWKIHEFFQSLQI